MTYEPKYLESGELNPLFRSRAGRYKKKFLESGEHNPDYKPNKSGKSGKGGKRKSLFDSGIFVGIDGEGADIDGVHKYVMLSASGGRRIWSENGLTSESIFDFLLETKRDSPKGIFCIYGGSYDFNFWLKDIPKETITEIMQKDGKGWVHWKSYNIRMVAKKFFAIQKGFAKGKEKVEKIQIWDVIGFFQSAFVPAVKQWIPDYPNLDLIIEGKQRRSTFNISEIDFISAYTDAELDALCKLMDKLRDGVRDLGLKLKGWHGAGAIATAMLESHGIKKIYAELPPEVHQATKHAYFGGRIEIGKYGRHNGSIYHYDINSAYPSKQKDLPALAGGQWIKHDAGYDPRKSENILIICKVRWDNIYDEPFCPFPYRSHAQRKVLYSPSGYNWIWKPEVQAALDAREKYHKNWAIEIEEAWEFIPADNKNYKPFHWIPEYFDHRKDLVAESKRTGKPNGQEKAIKLGLNSLYGKQAQRVGYDERKMKPPPYHNLAYAGYITSAARAQLYSAAMQAPDKIICLSTDGIYSQVPLDLNCPKEKILGEWEYQKHDEMLLVQSGVYFIRDDKTLSCFSRGFDKMTSASHMKKVYDLILDAWSNKRYDIHLPCTRFITLKSAMISDKWWQRWLSWYKFVDAETGEDGRKLAITPSGTKRVEYYGANGDLDYKSKRVRPDLEMQQTMPMICVTPSILGGQHDLPWDNADDDPDSNDSNIVIQEHTDSYL